MPNDLVSSLISQVQRSKDVTLLSRIQNLEKMSTKPKFYEPNKPSKFQQKRYYTDDKIETIQLEEEKEPSKAPVFFNSKKQTEVKLKKTAPEFIPTTQKQKEIIEENEFIITEDKFDDGPSENSNTTNKPQVVDEFIKSQTPYQKTKTHHKKIKQDKKKPSMDFKTSAKMSRF